MRFSIQIDCWSLIIINTHSVLLRIMKLSLNCFDALIGSHYWLQTNRNEYTRKIRMKIIHKFKTSAIFESVPKQLDNQQQYTVLLIKVFKLSWAIGQDVFSQRNQPNICLSESLCVVTRNAKQRWMWLW